MGNQDPLSSGAIGCNMSANKELGHDAAYPRRSVAGFPQDGDGVRGAVRDRGGLPGLLDQGPLGRQAGLRALQEHACVDDPRGHDVRVRGRAAIRRA